MKTQAISMPMSANQAYITRKNNNTANFNGSYEYVVVPAGSQHEDTFVRWAAKNIITASAFSLIWDLGTNVVSKWNKNVDKVPTKEMFKNVPKVAGIFLLVGGLFKAISNVIDKN